MSELYDRHIAYKKVLEFMRGDVKKTAEWFKTKNVLLGSSPNDMIRRGRTKKLLSFIEDSLAENFSEWNEKQV